MTLTAATTRRAFLEPALDARALNLAQQRLIHNPSPEPDSVLELLALMTADTRGEREAFKALVGGAVRLGQSNRAEGGFEARIAGAADRLAVELRDAETGGSPGALTAKAIARALREPLRTIARPPLGAPERLVAAGRAVGEIFALVPSEQLLSPAVEHELGREKFGALCALHAERNDGAGADGTAPAPAINGGQVRGTQPSR